MSPEAQENQLSTILRLAEEAGEVMDVKSLTGQHKGAEFIKLLMDHRELAEPETVLFDALADIRHAYDLLTEALYHNDERAAYHHYLQERTG